MILLDTNVIAELVRQYPDPVVVNFIERQTPDSVFTAAICEAEIYYGLARLPHGRRRDNLTTRLTIFLRQGFLAQILPFDSACAALYGSVRAEREAAGRPVDAADAMIAATGRACGAAIASRNLADFEDCGVDIVNPWDPSGRDS